jgi:hypothetical protein
MFRKKKYSLGFLLLFVSFYILLFSNPRKATKPRTSSMTYTRFTLISVSFPRFPVPEFPGSRQFLLFLLSRE